MDWLKTSLDWIGQLPPEVLLLVLLVGLGYVLKSVDVIANKAIPLVLLVIGGPLYYFIEVVGVRKAVIGTLIAIIAWVLHNQGLARIEDKIPWLKGLANGHEKKDQPDA